MKYGKNKPTESQLEFMDDMRQQGYKTVIAYGAEEAITALQEYLQQPKTQIA